MKNELTVYELGKLLKKIEETTKMDVLVKRSLSGGFITLKGQAKVLSIPTEQKTLKGNNIINLGVKNSDNGEIVIKLTGVKDSKFKVEVAPTKYRVVSTKGLSIDKVNESNEECKVRIDEDIIFTVHAPCEVIENLIKK